MRLLIVAVLSMLVTVTVIAPAEARRVAIVIGNAKYQHATVLGSPKRDADAVAAALTRLKFEVVIQVDDGSFDRLRSALQEFRREARNADVAVVYFSGHGVEIEGVNYLVPVDAKLEDASDAPLQALRLPDVINLIKGARTLRLVILDACRDNPFAARIAQSSGKKSLGLKGFAPVRDEELGDGTLVAFAAAERTTAEDRPGQFSTYTAALLKHIETPGGEIRELFGRIRDDVVRESGGKQRPHQYESLGAARHYLKPPPPISGSVLEAVRVCREVESMTSLSMLTVLEKQHKGTQGADCVAARISELKSVQASAPPLSAQASAQAPTEEKSVGKVTIQATAAQPPTMTDAERARSLNASGIRYMMDQCREAIPIFNKALVLEPKLSDPYFNIGFCKEHMGDVDGAVSSYLKAIELGPNNSNWARKQLTAIYEQRGAFDKAADAYLSWLSFDKSHIDPAIGLCRALIRARNTALATKHCNDLVGRWPKQSESHAARAQAMELIGDLQAAIRAYMEAEALSTSGEYTFAAAQLQNRLRSYDEAIINFETSITRRHKVSEAHMEIGDIAVRRGDIDGAIKRYGLSIAERASAEAYIKRGKQLEKLGEFPKAKTDYERALRVDPNSTAAKASLRSLQ